MFLDVHKVKLAQTFPFSYCDSLFVPFHPTYCSKKPEAIPPIDRYKIPDSCYNNIIVVMEVSWMRLADIAYRLGYHMYTTAPDSPEIDTLKIVTGPILYPDEHSLYFADEDALATFYVPGVNFAIPEDVPLPVSFQSILLLPSGQGMKASFDTIERLMAEELRCVYDRIKLMDALIDETDVQSFIDLCAEVLENPVAFGDMDHQLIAHSTNYSAQGILWEEHERLGRFSEGTVTSQAYQMVDKLIRSADRPVTHHQPITGHASITGKIVVDNVHVGYFSVIDTNRPFQEGDRQMVSTICELLKSKAQFITSSIPRYSELIRTLLEEKPRSELMPVLEFEHLNLNDGYQLLLIQKDERGENSTFLDTVTALLASYFPELIIARHNEVIVLVVPDAQTLLQTKEPLDLEHFLRDNGLCLGVSRRAYTQQEFKMCYEQAGKAVELGARLDVERYIFCYEEYATYHLWQTLSQCTDLRKYCHPAIFELMSYDKKHQTTLCETLETFLICGGSKTQTAKRLSIHKSSLIYRLEKLQETFALDLDDFQVRGHLYNTFQILQIL